MTTAESLVLTCDDVMPKTPAQPTADVSIVVVAQLNLPQQNRETYELLRRFTTVTLHTLQELGAKVSLIDVTAEEDPDRELLEQADGVLMLGGGDIDGSHYGLAEPIPNEFGRHPVSDDRQLAIAKWAIETDAIFLGVCRGSQVLNVACGGTLIPDIQPSNLHAGGPGAPTFLDETVRLVPGSRVHRIFNQDRITVRSGHHQAVDAVGEGLRVTAIADDGVIEGTERVDNTWIVGVQWHPEDDDGSEQDRSAFFAAFLDAVRSRVLLTANRG